MLSPDKRNRRAQLKPCKSAHKRRRNSTPSSVQHKCAASLVAGHIERQCSTTIIIMFEQRLREQIDQLCTCAFVQGDAQQSTKCTSHYRIAGVTYKHAHADQCAQKHMRTTTHLHRHITSVKPKQFVPCPEHIPQYHTDWSTGTHVAATSVVLHARWCTRWPR
jgi:hypothetical protein